MPVLPELTAVEQRILGSLLEKETTVPATYPMTINSLRTACNQSNNREPVTAYDEQTVHDTVRALKQRDLAGVTWQDSGRRTMKWVQTLSHRLGLEPDERALVTVLLLRGPQAAGALKSRTDRLHTFADRDDVAACLARMAGAEPPLVRELARRPGERDNRWIHLLGPVESGAAAESVEPTVDRDTVLAEGTQARDAKVRAAYGTVATAYADHLVAELEDLPFERWLLERIVVLAGARPVVEVGCGPGHVTDFLAGAGVDATGLDLTPEMVAEARRRFPDGSYEVGDLRSLMRPATSVGWGAVLAWYSLVHLAASELPTAVAALARPLAPNGWLVIALHAGAEVRHKTEWFDHEIDVDFVLHDPAEVRAAVEAAGLVDAEWYHRGPIATREETTERFYVLARKPE
ncbi:MAG: DUF480 domain-containing protein [Nocardioides sp.]